MARQTRHGKSGRSRGASASKWRGWSWLTRAFLGASGVAFTACLGVGMVLGTNNLTASATEVAMTSLSPIRLATSRPITRPLGEQHIALTPAPGLGPREVWVVNSVVHSAPPGTLMIAIILDDMGLDRARSEWTTRPPGPLTLSYMSYAEDLIAQTGLARARGHELMLHLPMGPEGDADPRPGALLMKLSDVELCERIDFALGRFPGFVAVNNHMGNRSARLVPVSAIARVRLGRQQLVLIKP